MNSTSKGENVNMILKVGIIDAFKVVCTAHISVAATPTWSRPEVKVETQLAETL